MEKVIGNWKKIDRNGSVYTEELVFIDRRQCKFILINHHEYSNVTKETIFKYKINKNGMVITFTSTDPQKPETSIVLSDSISTHLLYQFVPVSILLSLNT